MRVDLRKKIAMVGASGMCGNFFGCAWCRWLAMLLGNFLFGFQENGTISHLMVGVSFMEHVVEGHVLRLTPAIALTCVAASSLATISSWIICPALAFYPRGPKVFLRIFWWPTPVRVDAMNLSMRHVKTCCAFFAFVVLEWP
jgi:hypothetical protein